MERQQQLTRVHSALTHAGRATPLLVSGGVGAALSAAALCAAGNYRDAAIVAVMVLGAAVLVRANASIEELMIAWFVTSPVASYYLRVPVERSIITYDRAMFGLMILAVLVKPGRADSEPSPRWPRISITKFEAAWVLLSVAALVSVAAESDNVAYSGRLAIDAFWLPLIAFHLARKHLDIERYGKALLMGAIALALFLFAAGAAEFWLARDLFHFTGAGILREGERRVNGPFLSDSSYSIICAMLFLFLLSGRRLTRVRLDRAGRLLFYCAVASAAVGAMLPLFRAVAAAMLAGLIVLGVARRRLSVSFAMSRKSAGWLLTVAMLVVVGGSVMLAPLVGNDRLRDPRTVFGRLATWRAAAAFTLTNPAFGIGLGNYPEFFHERRFYRDRLIQDVLEVRAADSPHSNPLWIAAELGVIGLVLYLAANVYLFLMGWRGLKTARTDRQRGAAACFLALLAAYWIPGLALASGEYSDLNLYFLFLLGGLSQFSRSSQTSELRSEPAD